MKSVLNAKIYSNAALPSRVDRQNAHSAVGGQNLIGILFLGGIWVDGYLSEPSVHKFIAQ
jgi:hypothetical protein